MNLHDLQPKTSQAADLSFPELASAVWCGRLVMSWIVVGFLLPTIVWLHVAPQTYTATMIVSPADNDFQNSRPGEQLGAFGALLGLGQDQDRDQFEEFKALLASPVVAATLDKRHSLLKHVFSNRWDKRTQTWLPPQGFFAGLGIALYWMLDQPTWSAPSATALSKFIGSKLKIKPMGKTKLVQLSITDRNPDFVAWLLSAVYQATDDQVREATRARVEQNKEFLSRELSNVLNAEQKEAYVRILLQQQMMLMLASVDSSFAAKVVQPVYVSDRPTSPQAFRLLVAVVAFGIVAGAVISVGLTFLDRRGFLPRRLHLAWKTGFRDAAGHWIASLARVPRQLLRNQRR